MCYLSHTYMMFIAFLKESIQVGESKSYSSRFVGKCFEKKTGPKT